MRIYALIAFIFLAVGAGTSFFVTLEIMGGRIERLAGEGEAARGERDGAVRVSEESAATAAVAIADAQYIATAIAAGAQGAVMRGVQEREVEAAIRRDGDANSEPIPPGVAATIDLLYATLPSTLPTGLPIDLPAGEPSP